MVICSFGEKGLETVSNGSEITFNKVPVSYGSKHELVSTEYEECLEAVFQICKYSCTSGVQEITAVEHRELTRWLNRKRFLKLKILDEDHADLFYEASFNVSKIEIDGKLYGLELQVITNRPFSLKDPKITIIQTRYSYIWERFYLNNGKDKGKSTGKFVTSYDRNSYPDDGIKNKYYYVYVGEKFENKHSINDSSYEEGYIYPHTEIIISQDGNLEIYNAIEDRKTYIANCVAGEVITMDYPIIQSSISTHNIQNDFNWDFFRVANTFNNSRNDLTISLPCTIKVSYSPIVKVGL